MYTDTLAALASSTEATIVALWERWQAGEITEAEFVLLAAAALVRATARGTALADAALAAALSVQRAQAVPTLGLDRPTGSGQTAERAVRDTLTSPAYALDAAAAVAVTARSEALAGAQDAYGRAMRGQGVRSWTRVLNSGACELCQDLAGAILPASARMYHHRGCGCTQRPVD